MHLLGVPLKRSLRVRRSGPVVVTYFRNRRLFLSVAPAGTVA